MTKTLREPVTAEELVRRARELGPALKDRAQKCEQDRKVPDETISDFEDAGLLYVLQPAHYGGYELPHTVMFDIGTELGRSCPSSAWVFGVLSVHYWIAGLFSRQAQDDMWGTNPNTISSTSTGSLGPQLTKVDEGFHLVDGKFFFSSGCDFGEWAIIGGWIPRPDGGPKPYWFMVPRSEYEIIDNWYVSGLRGTGSKMLHIKDTLIPDHRAVSTLDLLLGTAPGGEVNPSPLFRMPMFAGFPLALIGPALGAAWGTSDALANRTRSKTGPVSPDAAAFRAPIELLLGQATAQLDGVKKTLHRQYDQILARLTTGDQITLDDLLGYAAHYSYAVRVCAATSESLFIAAGGTAISDTNPMQRFWRDAHAVAEHMAFDWEGCCLQYGRKLVGIDPGKRLFYG